MDICWRVVFLLLCFPFRAASDCSSMLTDQWIKGSFYRYEYYVTSKPYKLSMCESKCQNISVSSTLAKISTSMLTREFNNMLCLGETSFWIKALRSNHECDTMHWPSIQQEQNCLNAAYHCICQRNINKPSQPTDPPLKNFTQTTKNDFYATVYRTMTFDEAISYCQTNFNCSFMSFRTPIPYIKVVESLPLAPGSYWIHKKDESSNSCLVARKGDNVVLAQSSCNVKHYVICNDVIDETLPLHDEGFVKMISNMTVAQKQTKKWQNKLECADDRRKSAQTVGQVGLAIIVSVMAFFVCMDLQRVFSFVYRITRRHL